MQICKKACQSINGFIEKPKGIGTKPTTVLFLRGNCAARARQLPRKFFKTNAFLHPFFRQLIFFLQRLQRV